MARSLTATRHGLDVVERVAVRLTDDATGLAVGATHVPGGAPEAPAAWTPERLAALAASVRDGSGLDDLLDDVLAAAE